MQVLNTVSFMYYLINLFKITTRSNSCNIKNIYAATHNIFIGERPINVTFYVNSNEVSNIQIVKLQKDSLG